jgi:hypothetical protein
MKFLPDRWHLAIECRSRIPDLLIIEAKERVEELRTMLLAEAVVVPECIATARAIRER